MATNSLANVLLEVICLAPNACVRGGDMSLNPWRQDCPSANWRLLKKLDELLHMQQSIVLLTNGSTTQTLQLLIHNILSTIMKQTAEFVDRGAFVSEGYKLLRSDR